MYWYVKTRKQTKPGEWGHAHVLCAASKSDRSAKVTASRRYGPNQSLRIYQVRNEQVLQAHERQLGTWKEV